MICQVDEGRLCLKVFMFLALRISLNIFPWSVPKDAARRGRDWILTAVIANQKEMCVSLWVENNLPSPDTWNHILGGSRRSPFDP